MKDLEKNSEFLEFPKYDLKLIEINLEKKDKKIQKQLTLAIGKHHFEIKKSKKDTYETEISVKVIGIKSNSEGSPEKFSDIKEEQMSFIIEVSYNVSIYLNSIKESSLEAKDETMKKYAWFILYPTIRETINNLANKMGFSNMDIPYNVSGDEDEH